MEVVEELNTGGDGMVRSAVIRTKNGLTSRPITKLFPLEVALNIESVDESSDDIPCRKAKLAAKENIRKWTV